MRKLKISNILQQYLSQFFYRPPILFHSLFEELRISEEFYPILHQLRKQFANKLNPFNLCPSTIFFWFLIPPYSAIGVSISGLNHVAVYWRQQIEPNESVYVAFKILELRTPFPLTLLVMFACLGLVITDSASKIIEATRAVYEDKLKKREVINLEQEDRKTVSEEKNQTLVKSLNPFNLAPRMSIFFPVNDDHTTIGFLTINFQYVQLSMRQSLEPNGTITSLIRFLDLSTPFPVQVAVMLLSMGLFITGNIYKFVQENRK